MKYLLMLLLGFCTSSWAFSPEKQQVLEVWLAQQQNNELVASISAKDDSQHRFDFAFARLPYQGELVIYDVIIEPLNGFAEDEIKASKLANIELELLALPDGFDERYSHSYYSWKEANTLFWLEDEQRWVTQQQYYHMVQALQQDDSMPFWDALREYGDVLFLLLLLYFVASSVLANLRAKRALKVQQQAVVEGQQFMQRAEQLQQQNNQLLADILLQLRDKS